MSEATNTMEDEAEIADIKDLVSSSEPDLAKFDKLAIVDDEETEEEETPSVDISKPADAPPAPTPQPVEQTQAAATVSASELVTGDLPAASPLPPPGETKRGRGRPPGSPNKNNPGASTITIPPPADPNAPETTANGVDAKQAAAMTFDLTTNSLSILFGPEWRHKNKEEREGMIMALEMYLRTKNMADIPPGAILCFAIATYAAPRLKEPATAGKIKLGWQWLKNKWAERKARKLQKILVKPPTDDKNGNPFAAP